MAVGYASVFLPPREYLNRAFARVGVVEEMMAMRPTLSPERIFLFLWLSGPFLLHARGSTLGINYGQIANNLPSPSQVLPLLRSLNITRVKLYDADPTVLTAFYNSDIDFIIGISNEHVSSITNPSNSLSWIKENVQPHISQSRITCITVGNEVLSGNDTSLISNLLPAMQSVYQSLFTLGLNSRVTVTTAHSFSILSTSFPPSSGSFRRDLSQFIKPILDFHSKTKSPLLINAYPFFAYKADPIRIQLPYALFEPNSGIIDPNTNLKYDNMLYAQMDAVYSALKEMGYEDIEIKISETGWPSMGDPDEKGASMNNAKSYNGNLMKRIAMKQGTPMKPSVPIDVHVFALFNEDLKPGPKSERNYGLFYPDGSPVYSIGLYGSMEASSSSSSSSSSSYYFNYDVGSSSSLRTRKMKVLMLVLASLLLVLRII